MNIVIFQSSHANPYPLQIIGESNYRDEIEEVTGYDGEEEGIDETGFTARLILDDRNIHDQGNAVAVEINFKTVGYLSKPDARKYRAKLKELGLGDVVGECRASIKGGFIDASGEQADFGVRLDLDIDELKLVTHPNSKTTVSTPPQPASSSTSRFTPLRIVAIIFLVLLFCCTCTLIFGYIYGMAKS